MSSNIFWRVIAAFGALLQWASVLLLIIILYRMRSSIVVHFKRWARKFFVLAFVALFLKATMEIGLAVPGLTTLIYDSRSIVIGYLHLTLLGFVSFLCLSFFIQQGWLNDSGRSQCIGYMLFLGGFVVNELVLFIQGLLDWMQLGGFSYAREWLLAASIGMTLGIYLFWDLKVKRRI